MTAPTGEYLKQLAAELTRAGIRGHRKERILTEFEDHLIAAPEAELGNPHELATQFADEMGTGLARTAALQAFAALAISGAIVVARVATIGRLRYADGHGLDTIALLICILIAQVAFAAGALGLIRVFHTRGRQTIPATEATVLGRRAGVGLTAGAVTTLAIPFRAAATPHGTSSSTLSYLALAIGLLVLLAAAPAVIRAARTRPQTDGPAGDLMTDLAPLSFVTSSPTAFALLFAAGLAVVISLQGVVVSDPYDGMLRGLTEAVACLAGFALLGRYLGLREPVLARPHRPREEET